MGERLWEHPHTPLLGFHWLFLDDCVSYTRVTVGYCAPCIVGRSPPTFCHAWSPGPLRARPRPAIKNRRLCSSVGNSRNNYAPTIFLRLNSVLLRSKGVPYSTKKHATRYIRFTLRQWRVKRRLVKQTFRTTYSLHRNWLSCIAVAFLLRVGAGLYWLASS